MTDDQKDAERCGPYEKFMAAAEKLDPEGFAAARAEAETQIALALDAERWRYWRSYWYALCSMDVARYAGLDLRKTYVQSPADMDKVTDAAMAVAAEREGRK